MARICGLTAAFALPWHLYQLLVHRKWFLAEYFGVQLFAFGGAATPQTSAESQIAFYARRLFLTDPVLPALLVAAVIGAWICRGQLRRSTTLLPLCFLAVSGASLLAFHHRSLPYLAPAIPVLFLLCATLVRWPTGRSARTVLLAALAGIFLIKVAFPQRPWGLSYAGGTQNVSARALSEYANKNRGRELILVSPEDDFYSSVLPIPRVRYCGIDSSGRAARWAPYLGYLGIVLTADQFLHLNSEEAEFEKRLRAWGLPSTRPIGTEILARSFSDVAALIAAQPHADFMMPESVFASLDRSSAAASRKVWEPGFGQVFLLAVR